VHATTAVRLAGVDDIPELVRLRSVMWSTMGLPQADDGWQESCSAVLGHWFASGTGAAAVVDEPGGGALVACGVASLDQRLPGSSNPTGRYGYIANMVTEPAYRERGLAGQVLRCLLGWFADQDIAIVDLHASTEGESIYRAHGFTENRQPALRWRSG
jgi:GNAT superfamily N-acetyltransferase